MKDITFTQDLTRIMILTKMRVPSVNITPGTGSEQVCFFLGQERMLVADRESVRVIALRSQAAVQAAGAGALFAANVPSSVHNSVRQLLPRCQKLISSSRQKADGAQSHLLSSD